MREEKTERWGGGGREREREREGCGAVIKDQYHKHRKATEPTADSPSADGAKEEHVKRLGSAHSSKTFFQNDEQMTTAARNNNY